VYWPDVVDLKKFYNSSLGAAVRRRLCDKTKRFWPDLYDKDNEQPLTVLGVGYTLPYLQHLLSKNCLRVISLMPSAQGVIHWPNNKKNLNLLARETMWPLDDESVDRIIITHCLEYTRHPADMMEEAYRVLAPGGKILLIVPNRMSVWARNERTPFGYGHPYSKIQAQQLLTDSLFDTTRIEMGLLLPPRNSRIILRLAELWHRFSKRIWRIPPWARSWGGVIIIEAEKQVFAAHFDKSIKSNKRFIYRPARNSFGRSHDF
jgi:SAM-dependent methyltransferase